MIAHIKYHFILFQFYDDGEDPHPNFPTFPRLRYLAVEVVSENGFNSTTGFEESKQRFVEFWFIHAPSMQCLEVYFYGVDEEKSWWRRGSGSTEDNASLAERIPEEEGLVLRAEHE